MIDPKKSTPGFCFRKVRTTYFSILRAMRYFSLFVLLSVSSLFGQERVSHFIKRPSFQTGAIFQWWKADNDERLEEFVVPLVIHYAISERLSVSMLNTPTRAYHRAGVRTSSLTAFTDTRISSAFILGEERALLNFGVNIPSGPTALDPRDEFLVAERISTHALAMPTNYFGGGLEVSASIAVAAEAGKWILGGAVSGVYKGSYVPISGSGEYRPGPEASLSLGFDRPLGERSRIFGDAGYTWYGEDQSQGQNSFQSGGKITINLAGIVASEQWQASFLLKSRFKQKSKIILPQTSLLPVLNLLRQTQLTYGNEFEFSGELTRQMSRNHALLVVSDVRIYDRNSQGDGGATVGSLGPGWRGMVLPQLQLELVTRFSAGVLRHKLNESEIRGIEANFGVHWQF
jgi:hypothetical protein